MHIVLLSALTVAASPAALVADTVNATAPFPYGAWIALAIVVAAAATAWMLNHRAPKVRAFGTFLAALGCFAVVAWFWQITGTGILEHPKPNQTPMDSAKPALLWAQAGVASLAGLILLVTAFRQSRSTETLVLYSANEAGRYGRVSRFIHWTTAILFICLVPMGIFGSMIPLNSWFIGQYFVVHKTIGVITLGLFVFRVLWNLYSKRPELDRSLTPLEHRLAHAAHVTLYVLMIAIPVTGYVMTSLHGFGTYFFFWEMAPVLAKSPTYIFWGAFHKYILHYLFYVVLGAHVLGALKHQLVDKHSGALKRMVS